MRQSASEPTILLRRPLGRPVPGTLVDRILPPPRRPLINAAGAASAEASRAGGGRPRAEAADRPPPAPTSPYRTKGQIQAAIRNGQLPPRIPHLLAMTEAIELLGQAVKDYKRLGHRPRLRLGELLGVFPPDVIIAARWKTHLKQVRDAKIV